MKYYGAQPGFQLLAPITVNSDGEQVVLRQTYTTQPITQVAPNTQTPVLPQTPGGLLPGPGLRTFQGNLQYTAGTTPAGATATVLVANNDFSLPAVLYLGDYTITSGEDFTVGAGVAGTATALAAAIDGLPGFTAAAVVATVTITGPTGPGGNFVVCTARYGGEIKNYTLNPTSGMMSSGQPVFGPPVLG